VGEHDVRPVLLAVDGNSLLHRSFHAHAGTRARAPDGTPVWAVRGLLSQVARAVARVGARGVVIGFDDHPNNDRKKRWPDYKATRLPKPPELIVQLTTAVGVLRTLGLHVVVAPGLEADDVVASAARTATAAGWDTVVVTSDRDSFALISDTTRVLRLITGGVDASPVLTPARLHTLTGVYPHQYREFAALRGDSSDNLTGVSGIGAKTASRLLAELGSVEFALAQPQATVAVLGPAAAARLSTPAARAVFARNIELMTPVADIDLGLDLTGGGPGCLPLPEAPLRAGLTAAGLFGMERATVAAMCDQPVELGVDSPGLHWLMSDDAHLDLLISHDEPAPAAVAVAVAAEPVQGTLF